MVRRSLIQTALVATMVLVGLSPWGGSPALAQAAEPVCEAPRIGCLAPDFTLQDVNGNEVTLGDLRGRPVLVTFWFTGCPICQGGLANWQAFHDAYGDLVAVMGINVVDDPQTARSFLDRLGITLPAVLDSTGRTTLRYRVTQMPAMFFLDAAGVIRQISRTTLTADGIAQVFAQEVFGAQLLPLPAGGQSTTSHRGPDGLVDAELLDLDGDSTPDGARVYRNGVVATEVGLFRGKLRGMVPEAAMDVVMLFQQRLERITVNLDASGSPVITLEDQGFDGVVDSATVDLDGDGTPELHFP